MMLVITSLVKVKNEWLYTFPPFLCLYGVEQENFSFLTIICEYFQCCSYAVNPYHANVENMVRS